MIDFRLEINNIDDTTVNPYQNFYSDEVFDDDDDNFEFLSPIVCEHFVYK